MTDNTHTRGNVPNHLTCDRKVSLEVLHGARLRNESHQDSRRDNLAHPKFGTPPAGRELADGPGQSGLFCGGTAAPALPLAGAVSFAMQVSHKKYGTLPNDKEARPGYRLK